MGQEFLVRVFAFPGWWQVVAAMIVQAVSTASIYTSYSVIAASLQSAFEPSRMVLMLGMTATALASVVSNTTPKSAWPCTRAILSIS